MLALGAMTVISVGIGYLLTRVPVSMPMTEFLGQLLSAALLFYFGIRSLQVRESGGRGLGARAAEARAHLVRMLPCGAGGRMLTPSHAHPSCRPLQ